MLNFIPILSRLRAKLRPAPPLFDRAAEVVELEPGSVREVPPAIALPGELDRAKDFYGGAAAQLPRFTETMRHEGPTLAYRLDDAILADFTVYASGTHQVYRSGRKRAVILGQAEELEEAQLCTTSCIETYFGHFLNDGLPLELLAHSRGLPPISFERPPFLHEPGYRQMVGLFSVTTKYARARTLWLVDERALNDGWALRFGELRRRIRARVEPTGDSYIFLKRGSLGTASRHLINEQQVAEELESRGFRVIEPEKTDPASLCAALAGAKVVACVEGSAQNHAFVAMPADGAFLSIQPPRRFNSLPKPIVDSIGARFAYVVAEPRGEGFYLDPARFMRTLELLS